LDYANGGQNCICVESGLGETCELCHTRDATCMDNGTQGEAHELLWPWDWLRGHLHAWWARGSSPLQVVQAPSSDVIN